MKTKTYHTKDDYGAGVQEVIHIKVDSSKVVYIKRGDKLDGRMIHPVDGRLRSNMFTPTIDQWNQVAAYEIGVIHD